MLENVHISTTVSKLGANIPSVNLPPVITCRKDAPCYKKCYARKGRFSFQKNRALLEKNFRIWNAAPDQFEHEVKKAAATAKFFRWHSSGDIPDEKYLEMMVRIARETPDTKFLCFTKKFELVNEWLNKWGNFPANLNVVYSAWMTFIPDNPFKLPMAYINLKHESCNIPEDAHVCPKYCGDCVMTGCSCWDLRRGESVKFDEH